MAQSEKSRIIDQLDQLYKALMEESGPSKVEGGEGRPAAAFTDRLKLFEAGVKYLAVKNRVEDDEPNGGSWDSRAARIRRGTGRRRSGDPPAASGGNGAAAE